MEPNIWGPHAWLFLHTITLNFPDNPTKEEKEKYKQFFIRPLKWLKKGAKLFILIIYPIFETCNFLCTVTDRKDEQNASFL